MKKKIEVMTFTLLAMCLFALTPSFAAEGNPHLIVTQPNFTHKPVLEGDPATHQFVLVNSGDMVLLLSKITSG